MLGNVSGCSFYVIISLIMRIILPISELVASLEKENLYLREQNLKCQEQITLLERAATTQAQERSRCEDTISRLKGQLQDGQCQLSPLFHHTNGHYFKNDCNSVYKDSV